MAAITKSLKGTSTKANKQKKASSKPSTGAPAQHNQSSRKGKKAWRKNVDLGDVEEGLEELRAEERVTGTALQKLKNEDLFQIDVKGDDQVRKSLPRYSRAELTSTKIINQRSAVPAVFSRLTSSSSSDGGHKRKIGLSSEEKARLMRIAKRQRKGPFNSVMDPSEYEAGSSITELSKAVKSSGKYDPWEPSLDHDEVDLGLEPIKKKKVKPPQTKGIQDEIDVPAVPEPHEGTSYNPLATAHQELLLKAHEMEERRVEELEKLTELKKKIESARLDAPADGEAAPGMMVDDPTSHRSEEHDESQGEENKDVLVKKIPQRKTKAQRQKAARLLAEKRALAEKAARKRFLASIPSAKTLRQRTAQLMLQRQQRLAARQEALQAKLKEKGLAGQRFGKHVVPEGNIDVQLGEDLSESFRALKPEGNLFYDRFLSLQQRALVEPRVPILPRKRKNKIVEYEKHAWKRFE